MGKTVDEAQIPYRGFPFAADFPVYTDAMWLINSGTDLSLLLFGRILQIQNFHFYRLCSELNFDHIADLHFHGRFRRFAVDQHPSCVTRFIGYRSPFDQPGHF